MNGSDDAEYYSRRAATARAMAERAASALVSAIHSDLATRYQIKAQVALIVSMPINRSADVVGHSDRNRRSAPV